MPELIHDTVQHLGGNKNASVGGGWSFTNNDVPTKGWVETYLVRGDSQIDDEDYILSTSGLPVLGQYTRNAWCVNRTARCIDDTARLWEVTCTYKGDVSYRVQDSTKISTGPNGPVVLPWRLDDYLAIANWSSETIQEPLTRDAQVIDQNSGLPKKVTNVMGEPLFPPVERALTILDLDWFMADEGNTITYNMVEDYVNHINAGPFLGAPEQCVECINLEYTSLGFVPYFTDMMDEDPDNAPDLYPPLFYHFRAQFKFRFWYIWSCSEDKLMIDPYTPGWILKLLNVGNTMKKKKRPDQPSNQETERVGAAAIDKAPIRANLDMEGYPLDPTEDPIWLEYNRFPTANFDLLIDPALIPFDRYTPPDVPSPAPCLPYAQGELSRGVTPPKPPKAPQGPSTALQLRRLRHLLNYARNRNLVHILPQLENEYNNLQQG